MSTKSLISESTEASPPVNNAVLFKKVFGLWSVYMSGILAILQMAYGIGLVLFFFFSFDANYEKWEMPGAMVLTMVFTGFVVQGSALLVIIGHIQRHAKYVYMGCVFPFLEFSRATYIVLKSLYQIFFEHRGKVMSDQTWLNMVNSLSFLGFLGWFFFISLIVHLKTAQVIEHNEDEADEK